MNHIPIIRKDVYKDYLRNGLSGGIILGIIVFLFTLIRNSFLTSIYYGLVPFLGISLFFVLGFLSEEFFERKKKIKALYSLKYDFLFKNNFIVHPDLYFEGEYRNFLLNVYPSTKFQKRKKNIDYIIIEVFYDCDFSNIKKEQNLSGEYFIGELRFNNHCVGFIPKDWENPNFKENFEQIINIIKREGLNPISKENWEEKYGKELNDYTKSTTNN